jgi:MFS family permease
MKTCFSHYREAQSMVFKLGNAGNSHFFTAGILLNVFSQSLLRVVLTSRTAGMAGDHRRGEVLGVMSSVLSVATIGGPLFAGLLFSVKTFLPFVLSALVLVCGFLLMGLDSKRIASNLH